MVKLKFTQVPRLKQPLQGVMPAESQDISSPHTGHLKVRLDRPEALDHGENIAAVTLLGRDPKLKCCFHIIAYKGDVLRAGKGRELIHQLNIK